MTTERTVEVGVESDREIGKGGGGRWTTFEKWGIRNVGGSS